MPTYTHRCPDGHTSDVFRRMADMDVPHDCPECGQPTSRAPTAPIGFTGIANTVPRVESKANEDVKVIRYVDGVCRSCDNTDVVFLGDDGKPVDDYDRPCAVACSKCGSAVDLVNPKPIPSSVTYPYYNRGLGCEVTSPGHLRRLLRERGLVEASAVDLENAHARSISARRDTNAKVTADYDRTVNNSTAKSILDSAWYKDQVNAAVAEAIADSPLANIPDAKVHIENPVSGGSP